MTTWPATVPVHRSGYSETPPSRVIRSDMDVGPAKVRRRSSSAVRQATLKLLLTPDQIQDLDDFYLANDASAFDFVNPRTGETVQARFVDTPPYEVNETMFNVGIELEILP